jgi:hypothetical protein
VILADAGPAVTKTPPTVIPAANSAAMTLRFIWTPFTLLEGDLPTISLANPGNLWNPESAFAPNMCLVCTQRPERSPGLLRRSGCTMSIVRERRDSVHAARSQDLNLLT